MPYIVQEDRPKYDKALKELTSILKELPPEKVDGEMNYLITSLSKLVYPLRYYHINKAVGLLECIKMEFYRRVAAPYEDTKIVQNGDV